MFDRWYRWMVIGFDWTAKLVIQPINDWFTIWLKQFWGKTDSECWLFSLKGKNFPIIGEFPRTTSGILLQEKNTRSSIANHGRKRTTQSCANQIPRPRTPNIFHHIQWYFPINTMGSIYFIILPFYPMISHCIHRHPKRGVPHLSLGHLDRPGRDFWTGPSWGNLWVKSKHKWWNMISFDTS